MSHPSVGPQQTHGFTRRNRDSGPDLPPPGARDSPRRPGLSRGADRRTARLPQRRIRGVGVARLCLAVQRLAASPPPPSHRRLRLGPARPVEQLNEHSIMLEAIGSPETPAPVAVFAALLTPGSLRDGEVQEVVLPSGAELVRLDLQLTANAPAASYTARLTRQRETLLEQRGLSAHVEANTPVLSVVLRSSLLTAGTYRLYLTTSGPQPESVSYYFRIR